MSKRWGVSRWGVAALVLAIAILPRAAQGQVLNFEGILPPGSQFVSIGNFYDGGAGPNFGIDFSANALALCLNTPGNICSNTSRGGLGDPSSQLGGLFFLDGPSTFMNSNAGFTDGFSFFYSAFNTGGSFQVFSGLDGTGTLLASLTLGTTPGTCSAIYSANFCPFVAAGVSFAGTGHSVVFAGVSNQIVFDDVTFGSSTPGDLGGGDTTTPEPASIALMATGLCGAGIVARRRRPRTAA
jgi:hypothetical protein